MFSFADDLAMLFSLLVLVSTPSLTLVNGLSTFQPLHQFRRASRNSLLNILSPVSNVLIRSLCNYLAYDRTSFILEARQFSSLFVVE